MKVLGIESSGLVASTAIVVDGLLVAETIVNNKQTHSKTLLPMLRDTVEKAGVPLEELDAIAVSAGPGSFTGLRIGSSTAKGLGLALNKPIIGISSLEALAYNVFGAKGLVCPIMDAKRRQVYTAIYQYEGEGLRNIWKPRAIALEEWIGEMNKREEEVVLLGDGVPVYKEAIMEAIKAEHQFAPPHLSRQRAGAVAALGERYAKKGRWESADMHKPIYLRLTQAERERKERLRSTRLVENDDPKNA